jgi:phosphocarrier protein HPr
MIKRSLEIRNSLGLHARAAGALVRLSSTFQSEITVEKDGIKANSKSIMGLLMLAAAAGSTILVTARGGGRGGGDGRHRRSGSQELQ